MSTLSPDAQEALSENLTLGAGWTTITARRHATNPSAVSQLGMLGTASAALRVALEGLGADGIGPRPAAPVPPDDILPTHWAALAERAGEEAIGVWLQMAAEMARDAACAAAQNADVGIVRELLHDALETLATVRDDALGTGSQ